MAEQKAHALYSSSGSERWLNCSGSIKLSLKAPPKAESKWALEGTRAHECLEKILKAKNPRVTAIALKKEYPSEMVAHALKAAMDLMAFVEPNSEVLIEEKVDASSFTKEEQFGTVDFATSQLFRTLRVVDFKYGAGHAVDPTGNTQMIYYALGIAHKYDFNFEEVILTIVQPRAAHPRGPIRHWVTDVPTLLKWKKIFLDGVKEAEKPNAPLRPGSWCHWCQAASICPKQAQKANEKAAEVFDLI